eukprot:4601196-Amphidinium_carterae.1
MFDPYKMQNCNSAATNGFKLTAVLAQEESTKRNKEEHAKTKQPEDDYYGFTTTTSSPKTKNCSPPTLPQ